MMLRIAKMIVQVFDDEAPRAVYSVTISGKNANTKPKPATKKSSVKPPPAAIVDIKG